LIDMFSVLLYFVSGCWRSTRRVVGIRPLFKFSKHGCEEIPFAQKGFSLFILSPVYSWFADEVNLCVAFVLYL
jgi:hypothetical protein